MSERKCLICGKMHGKEMCPELMKRIRKFEFPDEEISFWGSVFVACEKNKTSFYDLLTCVAEYKISYLNMLEIGKKTRYFSGGGGTKRIAEVILGKQIPPVTKKDIYDCSVNQAYVGDVDRFPTVCRSESTKATKSVEISFETKHYPDFVNNLPQEEWENFSYEFYIEKEVIAEGEFRYTLGLNFLHKIWERMNRNDELIMWESEHEMCNGSIVLMSEKEGKLKNFF